MGVFIFIGMHRRTVKLHLGGGGVALTRTARSGSSLLAAAGAPAAAMVLGELSSKLTGALRKLNTVALGRDTAPVCERVLVLRTDSYEIFTQLFYGGVGCFVWSVRKGCHQDRVCDPFSLFCARSSATLLRVCAPPQSWTGDRLGRRGHRCVPQGDQSRLLGAHSICFASVPSGPVPECVATQSVAQLYLLLTHLRGTSVQHNYIFIAERSSF